MCTGDDQYSCRWKSFDVTHVLTVTVCSLSVALLLQRDKDFQERVKKHRFSAFSRYEDDYYGDKVKTLSDYRQWVRQQMKRKEAQDKFAASSEGTNTE